VVLVIAIMLAAQAGQCPGEPCNVLAELDCGLLGGYLARHADGGDSAVSR